MCRAWFNEVQSHVLSARLIWLIHNRCIILLIRVLLIYSSTMQGDNCCATVICMSKTNNRYSFCFLPNCSKLSFGNVCDLNLPKSLSSYQLHQIHRYQNEGRFTSNEFRKFYFLSMVAKTFLYEINTSLYKIINIDKNLKLWVDNFIGPL